MQTRSIRFAVRLMAMIAVMLTSWQCTLDKNHVVMEDVNTSSWDNVIDLHYTNDETEFRNLSLMLRVRDSFKSDELRLEITTLTPDSLSYNEQVIFPVEFHWQGSVARSLEIELPYRQGVVMKHKGEYIIKLRPLHPVAGIESAGINFKSTK